MSDFVIKALTPATFDDFAALVERNKGMFASCWCTHFHPDCGDSSFLYNGTRAMYEREGFTYDRPKGQGNCVMVRQVAAITDR
jgi:hypothetical protein